MTAAERYEAALRLLESAPTRQLQRGWLQFRIGCVRRFSYPRDALQYFSVARRSGEVAGDRALEAFALYGEGLLRFGLGDTERGAQQWRDGNREDGSASRLRSARMFSVNDAARNFSPDAMPDVFDLGVTSSGTTLVCSTE